MTSPKFTAREDFRVEHTTFEQGNTYDPAKHGITDDQLTEIWERGWADVEGWDAAPERQPGAAKVTPAKTTHAARKKEQ